MITKGNYGGAQRYVFDLATSLSKEEFDVAVALGQDGLLKEKLLAVGITVIPIDGLERDISIAKEIGSFFSLLKIIRQIKPDVVHLNSSKAGGLGALAARLAGVTKVIFTAHGWPTREKRFFISRAIIIFLSWLTATLCHTVIVVSEADYKEAAKWPKISQKLKRVYNGIGSLTFTSKENAREKLALPQNAFVIGSLGELTANKNYSLLISAAAKLKEKHPNFLLNILGDGDERRLLETKKKEEGLDGRVFEGFITDGYRYLKAYDVFVLPSQKEGFPYVLLEAGQACLPVVATSVGGIPEIIENGKTGFLIGSGDTEALTETLARYMDDPALCARIGNALKEKVEKEFSLEKMLESTMALYKN